MIQNLMFGIYLVISRIKSRSQQKLVKKITHFRIHIRSKDLTHFTNLNLLNIVKNILLQYSQKPCSLCKFSSKHTSGWPQKKHLHCAFSRRPVTSFSKNFESKCLYIPVYLLKNMVPET